MIGVSERDPEMLGGLLDHRTDPFSSGNQFSWFRPCRLTAAVLRVAVSGRVSRQGQETGEPFLDRILCGQLIDEDVYAMGVPSLYEQAFRNQMRLKQFLGSLLEQVGLVAVPYFGKRDRPLQVFSRDSQVVGYVKRRDF